MNENLFEYSDMLRSPIEAFCCGTGYWEGPVSSHWHYFLELVYVQEGSVTVSCNDNTCLLKKGAFIVFPPQAMHSIYHTDDKPYVYICCKFNLNRKIAFDAACRKMLFEIAKRHGLELEEEAEYGNRKYLEKQDFILAKQKEQLAAQQDRLDELTLKVSDMETLLDDVSAAAYDKAVEVVTETVRTETRKEDMRMIEDTKKWVLSPERKAPKATREYTAKHLDGVLDKFLKTMQTTAARLQEKLLKPEVRQKGKEQVKEKARDSVLQLLNRLQAEQTQRKPSALPAVEKSENRFQS